MNAFPTLHPPGRRGSTLHAQVAGTAVLAVLSGLSISGVLLVSQERESTRYQEEMRRAWLEIAAQDALDLAIEDLRAGGAGELAGPNTFDRGWSTKVIDLGSELRIQAVAYHAGHKARWEALADRQTLSLPAALVVESRTPDLAALMGALVVSGWDHDLQGRPPAAQGPARGAELPDAPDESRADLAVVAGLDAVQLESLATASAENLPSVITIDSLHLRQRALRLAKRADRRVDGGRLSSGWGDADRGSYEVVHVTGGATLADGFTGAGVLVVDGDLRLAGQARWVGVVLVLGDVLIDPEAEACLIGGLLVTGNVRAVEAAGISGKKLGTLSVLYSSEARQGIAGLATYEVTDRYRIALE